MEEASFSSGRLVRVFITAVPKWLLERTKQPTKWPDDDLKSTLERFFETFLNSTCIWEAKS